MVTGTAAAPTVVLVDAANVVGSRPDGWWRDRPGAARRLVARIRAAAAAGLVPVPVVVVLEGAARRGVPPGAGAEVDVVHAPGEGDHEIAARARAAGASAVVVTADRGLAARVRAGGAEVVGPSWLWGRLDGAAG